MSQNFEQQWAEALKKSRQQARHKTSQNLVKQEKNIMEQMKHYKEKLLELAREQNSIQTQHVFKKLIELRAFQLAVLIQKLEKKYGVTSDVILEPHIKKYQIDCLKLATAVDSLIGIGHKV